MGRSGKQSFALEKSEKIAIHARVNLKTVTAVLDNVGIDKAGHDPFLEEGFTEGLGESGSAAGRIGFGYRLQRELMLAGVGTEKR